MYHQEEEPIDISARSGKSKSSTDVSLTDSYGRELSHPPSYGSLPSHGSSSNDSYERLSRRISDSGGRKNAGRKKLKYENEYGAPAGEDFRGSVTNSVATEVMGNVGSPGGQGNNRKSISHNRRKSNRGSEHVDDTIITEAKPLATSKSLKTEKTSSLSSSSTGSRRRRKERERLLRANAGLDDSIDEDRVTPVMIPRVSEKNSSLGSSSAGSRRRRAERERIIRTSLDDSIDEDRVTSAMMPRVSDKNTSVGSSSTGSRRRRQELERLERERQWASRPGPSGPDLLDGSSADDRISPIMEGIEVGGENFVEEFRATDATHASTADRPRGERAREYSRGEPSRGNRGNDRRYEQMDWPVPQDHFMDDMPPRRTASGASASSSQHSGGAGAVLHMDDVANAQQAPLGQEQSPQPPGPRRAVLHACDDKGRCLFHPHVVLRKKAFLGALGGWKDVLPACPECENEDMGGGSIVEGGDISATDKTGMSGGSGSRRASFAEDPPVSDDGSTGGSDDDSEDDGGDGESSSSSGEGSSGSSSSDGSSSSSDEDTDDQDLDGNQAASAGHTDRALPPRPNRNFAGGALKINKLASGVASGAGSKIKKLSKTNQTKEDYISAYISSGVPSRPTKNKSKAKSTIMPMEHDPFFDRPVGDRRRSATEEVEAEEELPLPQSLAQDESIDDYADPATAHSQHGKKVLKGVSKGVSKFIGKSRKKIAKGVKAAGAAKPRQGQASTSRPVRPQSRSVPHNSSDMDQDRYNVSWSHSQDDQGREYFGPNRSIYGRRSSGDPEGERGIGNSSHRRHRLSYQETESERRRHGKRTPTEREQRRKKADPNGNSLFINEGRVRNTGSFTVGTGEGPNQGGQKGKKNGKKAGFDHSMGSFAASSGHTNAAQPMDVDVDESPEEESSSQRLLKDASYQWDRMPLPQLNEAATTPTDGPAEGGEGGDSSAQEEESSSQRLLKDASYQWDRVPLPEMASGRGSDNESDDESDEDEGVHGDVDEEEWQEPRRQNSQEEEIKMHANLNLPQQDELMKRSLESLNMDDEVLANRHRLISTSSASNNSESKSQLSGEQMGLLSMEDLLQSIQNDISMSSAHRLDRASGSSSRGAASASSSLSLDNKDPSTVLKGSGGSRGGSTPMPQLDHSGSSREDNVSMDEEALNQEEELDAARWSLKGKPNVDGVKEEGENPHQDNPTTQAHSSEQPSDAPKPLPLLGNYGGLKIDLSSLQASKPMPMKIQGSTEEVTTASGGLNIDLSSLQASKPTDKQDQAEEEALEGAGDAPLQTEEAPLFDESVKTFETTNLPYTGEFGESGMYTGSVNQQYEPHGKGTMVYDNGQIMKGYWNEGGLVRESELYSDEEDDDEDDDEEEDLSSSMANVSSRPRDRSRSRSRSRSLDRRAATQPTPPPPPTKTPSPPPPEYKVGDAGKHRDMILDKEEALVVIEHLKFGDGAFIRRSDGKWTYAVVKSLEETSEGKSAIRFTVNNRNSSKSYAKKYWGTHVRPVKGTKIKVESEKEGGRGTSAEDREGRAKQREATGETASGVAAADGDDGGEVDRGASCPPTQSRLTFDWGMGPQPVRHGRSRSRSRRRAVSFSPMRALTSIAESDVEDEEDDDIPDGPLVRGGLGALSQKNYELKGVDP